MLLMAFGSRLSVHDLSQKVVSKLLRISNFYHYFCILIILALVCMKKLYYISLVFLSLLFAFPASAQCRQKINLSDSAYASILTCGPGNQFYENYGHTALRICDNANNIDYVFNYGTFDFDVEGFYFKFARGSLNYCLAIESFNNFMFEYEYYGRAVFEQRLNLSKEQCATLFSLLLENARPENKNYKYDFFRDNCATRVDDMVGKVVNGNANFSRDAYVANDNGKELVSYRDLLYKYNPSMPWWKFGTDLLLGARCDRPITIAQHRYIPVELMQQYDTIMLSDGSPLAANPVQLLDDSRSPLPKTISPTLVMWLLFFAIAALSLYADRRGWSLLWFDAIFFSLLSFISLFLLFMWFGSDHWCTKWNLNIIWANPLILWPLFRLRKPRTADCLPLIAILLILILGWPFWPQQFNSAVLPIVLIIITRLSVRLSKV